MGRARKTLAIVAFAAMVGCTVKSPASTPMILLSTHQLHSSPATYAFTRALTQRFAAELDAGAFDVETMSFHRLLAKMEAGSVDYFISSHVPARDDIWAAPLGVDGLAIVINAANDLSDLTASDLRAIFSGRVRDWGELAAQPRTISPLAYQPGSDTALEFRRLIMGITPVTGNALLMPNIESMLQQVSDDTGAIGYLPLAMVDARVKPLAIDGVFPSQGSVGDRRYPLRSTIYVVGREAPPPAPFNFLGWIQSEAGQAVVGESYTPLP